MSAISNVTSNLISYLGSDSSIYTGGLTIIASSIVIYSIFKCASCEYDSSFSDKQIKNWETDTKKIQLITDKDDLKWKVIDKKTGAIFVEYAVHDLLCYETYLRYLTKDPENLKLFCDQGNHVKTLFVKGDKNPGIEWLRTIPLHRRISFFKENELDKITFETLTLKTIEISLKLISSPSQYNKKVMLTRDNWAVTVLCRATSGTIALGHTVIAYEGLIEGKPFVHYAHLVEDKDNLGFAKILPIRTGLPLDKSHILQSQTWQRSSYLVTLMINKIDQDIENQKQGRPYVFSLHGRSILSALLYAFPNVIRQAFTGQPPPVRHSCHSWAVRVLYEAKIEAGNFLTSFVTSPILETALLKV